MSEAAATAATEPQGRQASAASPGPREPLAGTPDERHLARAAEYLSRLRPRERPGTAQALQALLRRRGCCAYRAPVPLAAVAARLRDLAGEEEPHLLEALAPFEAFRPVHGAASALAGSAAARVALLLRRGQSGLGVLLARNAWADCRVEPQALVEALLGAGAVSQAGAGRLGYDEDALAELRSRPCEEQSEAPIPTESVDVDLGGLFEAKQRAQELRGAKGGLAAVVRRWLHSACEACLLQGRPEIAFAFAFAPGTPELTSRVLDAARRDVQDSFSPGISTFAVPVAAHPLLARAHGPRIAELQARLKCRLRLGRDPPGFTVVTGRGSTASREQVCELVELLFGEGSAFSCGWLPRESLARFIGRGGQRIAALEREHGVNLHAEVPADKPGGQVQVFGCIAPRSLRSDDPAEAIAELRERLAAAPERVSAALQQRLEDLADSLAAREGGEPRDARRHREPPRIPRRHPPRSPAARPGLRRVAPMLGDRPVTRDELRDGLRGQGVADEEEVGKVWESLLYPLLESFDDADLDEELLRGVYSYGFERPSAVQQRGILPIIDGRDTIAQAQSGTGKTATFVIGVLQRVDYATDVCQALVLAPTRELALQTHKVVLALGDYLEVRCHCCIGGTSVRHDIDQLRLGQQVVVGMPGRVYDMISKRHLCVNHIATFVLDEADELLSRGMRDQVYDIIKTLPVDVAVAALSATMPEETLDTCGRFMRSSLRILVRPGELCLEGVSQFYVAVEREEWKLDTVCDLYETLTGSGQAIVYANTRRKADFLADQLSRRSFVASCLHADLDQRERDLVMREFRSGRARLLLTTDTLARGIDVQMVKVVVNYDLPASPELYLHRVGRCGRFGRRGVAISLVTNADVRPLRDIERFFATQVEELPMDFEDLL
uniref:RNA helicase n=1 Tax=Alexandrium monilatum TaxID=311494 RepID=A0A7S4SST7_9DINO|mmetsp:Transcript_97696/g.301192  ORF Transcript_97696/g.301192 Transcript_97696/m.301192 type:complete len:898 (-) Transcript_97696:42-2735(-)